MKCNVGNKEKVARSVIGIVMLVLGWFVSPWFYLLAAIAIITAAIGFCPLTALLGINTCEVEGDEKKEESEVSKDISEESDDSAPVEKE